MKTGIIIIALFATVNSALSASLSINATAPSEDVAFFYSNLANFTYSRCKNDTLEAKGQSFYMSEAPVGIYWDVHSLSIRKNGNQTFESGDKLKLWVFNYTGRWNGTTSDNGLGDGDPLSGTTLVPLIDGDEVLLPTTQINGGQYLTFTFESPITLVESNRYAFLIQYIEADTATGPNYFQFTVTAGDGSDYPDGTLIRTEAAENFLFNTQDAHFYLTGVSTGAVIAAFADEFPAYKGNGLRYNGTEVPATGWSYLWNTNGVMGDTSSYDELVPNTAGVDPQGSTAMFTLVSNVAFNAVGQGVFRYGRISLGSVHPGQISADYRPIIAYTIQPGEEGSVYIVNSFIRKDSTAGNGVDLDVYVNGERQGAFSLDGFNSTAPRNFDGRLGSLNVGDTIYVSIGHNGNASGDATILDFQLESRQPGTTIFFGKVGVFCVRADTHMLEAKASA